jgi:hypothetical protein
MIRLRFESLLAGSVDAVLSAALTMPGVNAELMPLLRMTYPAQYRDLDAKQAPVNTLLFRSWLLLFGFIPVDLHALAFERLLDNGFDERSTSGLQQVWIHRRRVEAVDGGARVTDELEFQPRLPFLRGFARFMVVQIFTHRHRRLRARYGEPSAGRA